MAFLQHFIFDAFQAIKRFDGQPVFYCTVSLLKNSMRSMERCLPSHSVEAIPVTVIFR